MDKKVLRSRLKRRANRSGLDLQEKTIEQICVYLDLLQRWNARMNLSALDNGDKGLDRLIIEPLVAARHLPSRRNQIIDIGSGGGSPAVPLKLMVPDITLLMVEAKTRKAAFLRELVRQLELKHVSVETARYESLLASPELHESHDVLTIRAVRIEERVLKGLQEFVKPGGELFLFRGSGDSLGVPMELKSPLEWHATYPLVESLRSRLVVLKKAKLGRAG
jgi:16S rRNA (guanine527-N7)-methyltransferase